MRAWCLLLVASLLVFTFSGTALPPVPTSYPESFETGWGTWNADHHLQCEETMSCTLDWSLERVEDVARTGTWSLESYINGIHDDGVVWAEALFHVTPGEPIPVLMVFHVRSDIYSDVNNWNVVAYLGGHDPEHEDDFTIVGLTDRGEGWRTFCLAGVVTPSADGSVWAAAGISVIWEGPRTYHMDDIVVGLDADATGCAGWPVCLLADLPVCDARPVPPP